MQGAALLTSPNASRSAYDNAIKLFERALALDPQNFQAMRNLAAALAVRVENNWGPPTVDMARAEELLNAAAALRPDDSNLHLTKGYAYSLKSEWRSALSEAEAAIANDPSSANAYAAAALHKMYLGRSNDGLADVETALPTQPSRLGSARLADAPLLFVRASRAVGAGDRTVREGGRCDWRRHRSRPRYL
jgi:tetratricopeptide (TPR) repeat protein